MLIKDFYTVTSFEQEDQGFEAKVKLNPAHHVYQGHFPDQPVVPGVIQLQMIRELAEHITGLKLLIDRLVSAKFLNLITPEQADELTIKVILITEGSGIKFTGTITATGLVFTKVKGTFGPAGNPDNSHSNYHL